MSDLQDFKLKELANCQTGPFGSQLHESDYVDEGTPIVTVEHLGIESFTTQNLPLVSEVDKKRLKKYVLKEGDIVFSRVGSIDRCTYVTESEEGWMFSGRCIRVRPTEKVNSRYLAFYFRQDFFKRMMLNISVGATMPSLNTKLMDNIPLQLPSIGVQNKVAKFLTDLDNKILLNREINECLEAKAKLIYDYWFVQFDFPDKNGKPYKSSGGKMVYNEELKREIPEGWVCANLSSITHLNPSLSIPKGQVANHLDMRSFPEMGYMTELPIKKEYKGGVKFQNGDVVIARITPCLENGKTAFISLLDNDEIGFGSTEFIVLRGVDPDYYSFLAFLARSISFRTFAISKMTGTSGRRRVSASDIGEYKLAIPNDLTLFSSFNKLVMPKLKLMTSNTKENDALSKSRDWLLPMLMNGQVTIKD